MTLRQKLAAFRERVVAFAVAVIFAEEYPPEDAL